MALFNRKSSRPPVTLTPPKITFVGEQDGPPERDLTARFMEMFRDEESVLRAYLARAEYGDGTGTHVVLCIRSENGECPTLHPKIGAIFAGMFGSHEHLDTLFIRDDQEQELSRVCRPFYTAG